MDWAGTARLSLRGGKTGVSVPCYQSAYTLPLGCSYIVGILEE